MDSPRFKAFISYSHRDQAWARWLQRALERYRVPSRLVGSEGEFGSIPRRLAPVFRDREDLSSASDLGGKVKEALQNSETLIVICSPASATSGWVSEEIRYFASLGRENRILALIVDGDPQAGDPAQQCFPSVLVEGADGIVREPLAADARKWADGKLLAKLKIISGVLGIPLDALRRRDMQRRQRQWMMTLAGVATVAVVMTVLAIMAITARQAAENRREHAENLVGYMVGDLKTKLDEVGRLDILEGMGGRVSEYLESLDPGEVTDESLVQQAQVWRQLGEVAMDQGELSEALRAFTTSHGVLAELQRRNPDKPQYLFEMGNAVFWVGYVQLELGLFDDAEAAFEKYLDYANRLVERDPENPDWVMEKSYAHSNLAALIIRRGSDNSDQALRNIEIAVEWNSRALEMSPDDESLQSEYGETLAWLADTHLLVCNLGEALQARQENVAISRQRMENEPNNVNRRGRYAFSLTGLAGVARQVGLTDLAIENLEESRNILGQLSLMDPSNTEFRYDYFDREVGIADLLSETGKLEEALVRMQSVREPLLEILQESDWQSLRGHIFWSEYLLAWSDAAFRAGDEAQAAALLDEATGHLVQLLEKHRDFEAFEGALLNARFIFWQQRRHDLFETGAFRRLPERFESEGGTCRIQASLAEQAILSGDEDTARTLTGNLLSRGYYEPGFVRVCRQYGFCQDGA
jgi:tetratricopeptide (TPR) repeat protein